MEVRLKIKVSARRRREDQEKMIEEWTDYILKLLQERGINCILEVEIED